MRISPNNPVRRCLFPADDNEESRTDNLANALKESFNTDLEEKTKKYNYDFKNDRPLEGNYIWLEGDGRYDLIGVRVEEIEEVTYPQVNSVTESENSELDETKDPIVQMQKENEVTPKIKDDTDPPLRKRKNCENGSASRNITGVKRRLYD